MDRERSLIACRSACGFSEQGLSDTHCTAYAYGSNGTAYLYYVNSWRSGSRGSFGLALASAIDPNARRVLEAHQQAERLQVSPQPDGSNPAASEHPEDSVQ